MRSHKNNASYTKNMKSPHNVILSNLLSILFSVALTSCSKNLTRTEAQSQLEASYKAKGDYVRIETGQDDPYHRGSYLSYVMSGSGRWRQLMPDVAPLSDAGLLKVTVVASGVTVPWQTEAVDHIVITATEKAKPFLLGPFPTGSSECSGGCFKLLAATPTIEILGIAEPAQGFGQTMSSVKFRVSWKNTQVGDILKTRHSVDEEQATFVKYDNGWRLEK